MENTNTKRSPLMVCHLVLMILFGIASIAAAVTLSMSAYAMTPEKHGELKSAVYTCAFANLLSVVATASGIMYLLNGYSKSAASHYKAFMLFNAFSALGSVLIHLIVLTAEVQAADATVGADSQHITRIILLAGKIIFLCILTFGKDLGKRNTWMIFAVLAVLEIAVACLGFNQTRTDTILGYVSSYITTSVTHLLMLGTIGLAIKGKYDDKSRRGTT